MMSVTAIAALLLCSLSWISVSGSEPLTVEVQPGKNVTLTCNNMSNSDSVASWFRLVSRTEISCISVMFRSKSKADFCDGFRNGKFEMSSNITTVFLYIKEVNLTDSGLYFCGFYPSGRPIFNVIHLNIIGSNEPHDDVNNQCKKECDGTAKLTSVILGGLTALLVMVITGLVVKNRKLQKADTEEQNPEKCENVASVEPNYAAVTFRPKAERRQPEPNVVYAATR